MKRTIGYLSLSAVAFLLPLLFLYIGFISPAKTGAESPFIRMTVCTVLGFLLTSLFTRFIHPYSGLAGLDSAKLNLGFTVALLLAVLVEFVSFGGSTLEPFKGRTLAEELRRHRRILLYLCQICFHDIAAAHRTAYFLAFRIPRSAESYNETRGLKHTTERS